MPKLSAKTLEKRFPCPHCGQSFKGRQGLSGHIQFKHKPGVPAAPLTFDDEMINLTIEAEKFKNLAKVTDLDGNEAKDIVLSWRKVKILLNLGDLKVNTADYKTYLLMSLAMAQANKRLSETVILDLANGIGDALALQLKNVLDLKNYFKIPAQ